MKTIILGAIGSLVAGLLLFLLQNAYENYSESNEQLVEVLQIGGTSLMTVDQAIESAKKSQNGLVAATPIVIKNVGSKPIIKRQVRISAGRNEISGVFELTPPNDDNFRSKIRVENGTLLIDYNLFNPNEDHSIVILSDGAVDYKISSDIPNLHIENRTIPTDIDDSYIYEILVWISGILLFFIFGASTVYHAIKHELLKRGVVLDQILKEKTSE